MAISTQKRSSAAVADTTQLEPHALRVLSAHQPAAREQSLPERAVDDPISPRDVEVGEAASQLADVPDRDWQLGLANDLQTTLEVEELIRLFSRHAGALLRHDGVSYKNELAAIRFKEGHCEKHSCTFDLVQMDKNLGTVSFSRARPFSSAETTALESIIVGLVHPLRNCLMYKAAVTAAAHDPLTGVYNRASLSRVLQRDIGLAKRHGTTLSVIMLDADRFKQVNDRHGHVVGDYVLTKLADCLSGRVRDSDSVFRYGGEEFTILLSNTTLDGAAFLAERLRKDVEKLVIKGKGFALKITVSIGVAALEPHDDKEQLLQRADRALYASKSNGRNCVTSAQG